MTKFVNPVKNKETKYFNGFNLISGLGPIAFKKLLNHFKSLEYAWNANINEFYKTGLNKSIIEQIKKCRSEINLDFEMERITREKVNLITIKDRDYPEALKEIYNPPAIIYIRGNLKPEDKFALGVVGTRNLSPYGRQITPLITAKLVKNKLTIISGLAKGIDTLAHQAALKTKGRTIAVLGAGVDKNSIYPRNNKYLAEEIAQNGALISEYPIGAQPSRQSFPQRNRIISGLSLGVLVIEAPEKSGALITAYNALEQNRDVFAVPGQVFSPNSAGPNRLIKMGAKLVNDTKDIIEELNYPH